MLPRLTLSAKIFCLAYLNLFLLGLVFLIFTRVQYRLDMESFLLSPAQDRILSVARQFALELRDTNNTDWDGLVERFAKTHNVELRLVDHDGGQLAGPMQPLPSQVAERFAHENHHAPHESHFLSLGSAGMPPRHWVGVRIPVPGTGDRHSRRGALIVGAASFGNLFFFDPKPWLAVGAVVIVVSVACWLPLVRSVTRCIAHMTAATAQMAEGQFDVQLPVTRRDEIGRLSASINQMATRLSRFITGQKRFLGDAAHELCSPVARIQVALGILERTATPEQADSLADLRDDVEQMSRLVADVLSFSKAGLRQTDPQLEPVNLSETAAYVINRESVEGVDIRCSVDEQIRVMADKDLLSRAISNVLRNAIRYAGQAGPICVSARRLDGSVVLSISDSGPGLPEKDLEAVFEPFYRPASARERDTGGVGLGLAIVKTCIDACKGTVLSRNLTPSGLEVEMRLLAA